MLFFRSTFHANLVVLAMFDMAYISHVMLEEIPKMTDYFNQGTISPDPKCIPNPVYVVLYPKFIWPMSNVYMTASIYMTVVISLDR